MKKLLGFLILALCCAQLQAQNIEGQIIASQYQYTISGYAPNTYSWPGGSCNVAGPQKQFAFSTATPITIIDGNPSLTETVTPTAYLNNNQTCAISIAPVNNHQVPFSVVSGTGGLQEAINLNLSNPQPNTIILDNAWYANVGGPTKAAAIIAAAHGVTTLSLQDVTQAPNTYYAWNGSQYIETTVSGQSLATYTTPGLQGGGKCYVYPSSISTDAFAAINACSSQLPSAGGTIDATALGTANYTVTTQLTALNNANQAVTLLLNSGTTFTINTAFSGTLSNSPSYCAVPVGPGYQTYGSSGIVVPGHNEIIGNFLVGPSARVWDIVCTGVFTGDQESLSIDGVTVEGNSSATVMGALFHYSGVFVPTSTSNSGTFQCFAQCWEVDAGSSQTAIGNLVFVNDNFSDGYGGSQTYPGSVLKIDALTSAGEAANINFFGGMVQANGPHNPLLVINGRGGVQTDSIGFFGTTFQTAAATTSIYNSNVDPIQLTDVSSFLITNLRVAGPINTTYQPNLVDIFGTRQNAQFGINLNQITAYTGNFACLVKNNVEGTCETGYPTGYGDTALPNYTYGQVFPQIRQTNIAAPTSTGVCSIGSVWTNSSDTTSGSFKVCQGTPGSQAYTTIGGSGTTSFQVGGTPVISGGTINFVAGANTTITNPAGGEILISSTSVASTAWSALTPGTNTAGAFLFGSGSSLAATGAGSITATAVPWSGITGIPQAAYGTLGISSPDNVTLQATSGVFAIKSPGNGTLLGYNSGGTFTGFALGAGLGFSGSTLVNTSTANTVSASMSGACLPVSTGANSIGCSLFFDTGTIGSYTGVGGLQVTGGTGPSAYRPTRPGNAASNALPTCNSSIVNTQAVVNDASTTPTFYTAYTGGGTIGAPVMCVYNGSSYGWVYY